MTQKRTTRAPYGAQTPTERLSHALLGLYRYFNKTLFAGTLPEHVILIVSRTRRCRGYFAPDGFRTTLGDGTRIPELALTPTAFHRRARREAASTLVHEMVHLWQWRFGKPGAGGYHNREWGDRMEALGLMPSTTGEPGAARRGRRVTHYVIDNGPFDSAFAAMPRELWLPFVPVPDDDSPREQAKRRDGKHVFVCECGDRFWGKATLKVQCLTCGSRFLVLDADETHKPNDAAI